jgi:phosphatidate phosphatase APP1
VTDLKILCDIDDTVQARLHDDRYPKRTVYPGVVAFIEELERGGAASPGMPGDLTFITARPMDFFGLVENYTRDALGELGMPSHTVLSGSFLNLLTHDSMADKKIENFNRYRLIFPEAGVIFIGDSGQGDVAVGTRMLEIDREAVRGIFIHDVRQSPREVRDGWRDEGIIVFDTYIGAAAEARARGMISAEGFQRVIDEAQQELTAIKFPSEDRRRLVHDLLKRDLARATTT